MLPTKINILAELERYGVRYNFSGSNEVRCLCPFHDDRSPSCSINTEKATFYCHVCKRGDDFVSFLAGVSSRPAALVEADLAQRYDISSEPTIDPQIIEKWHSRIWDAGPLLKELRARAVSDEMIRAYRLGEHEGRVTIPIKNISGRYVNVRKYLPGAPGADKMKNLKGRGKPRLFPLEQLKFEQVALCGGEIKAVVAAAKLNPYSIGGIGTTCGEGNWDPEFTEKFKDKTVYIIYDIDKEGVESADRIAATLFGVASAVYVIHLPLDIAKFPTGDVNDFVMEGGDLKAVIDAAQEWKPQLKKEIDETEEPESVSFTEAYSSKNTKKRLRVEGIVTAIAEKTYVIPSEAKIECDRAQECCPSCAVYVTKRHRLKVKKEDPAVLDMVDAPRSRLREAMMRSAGIPMKCPSVSFDVESYLQADDMRVSPKLEILSTSSERTYQQIICVREGAQLNENYAFVGRQYPHPVDQSATLLASAFEPVGDALSHYDASNTTHLEKFKPASWTVEALKTKLDELYSDLERNVTKVYQRRDMHLTMDLMWHSPLFLTFGGDVKKGYTDILIMGDSAQGKSECAERLLRHYGVGVKVECKNATVAGLLGGVQQLGGRWYVTWGVIPTNDKRAVIMEEVKGASTETLSKLTDMRSSGLAEMPKIEKRRTTARTRLLWLSNARSDRPMSGYNYGIEAIKELIGALEDIRRFDMCLIVNKNEIDSSIIDMPDWERPAVEKTFDAVSCRDLVLWAWTRSAQQVTFDREAESLTLKSSSAMCEKFTSDIPIVDVASMRYKIARLAAALAARTFSSDDGKTLVVRPCHVAYVVDFLTLVYSKPTFGYSDYTKATTSARTMADAPMIEKAIMKVPHAKDFAENLLRAATFDQSDVQDWCGYDRPEAAALVSLLVRKRAITKGGRGYAKSPPLIDMLKRLIEEGKLPEAPGYMQDGEF